MLTRDGAGRILRARWPPLLALTATLAYAVVVIGFGLDFRPLHNDEGVTLGVASRASALDVLRVAVDHRHGPPLHYLLVHASLTWRYDILGLRLPSALLGIVAVAASFGFGRELVGRAGGAVIAIVTASSPVTIHLGQFARGYTAMIAAAYISAWLMLVLVSSSSWPRSRPSSCGTGWPASAALRPRSPLRSCSAASRSCCCAACTRRCRTSTASGRGRR
jgi:hypothetical protein